MVGVSFCSILPSRAFPRRSVAFRGFPRVKKYRAERLAKCFGELWERRHPAGVFVIETRRQDGGAPRDCKGAKNLRCAATKWIPQEWSCQAAERHTTLLAIRPGRASRGRKLMRNFWSSFFSSSRRVMG